MIYFTIRSVGIICIYMHYAIPSNVTQGGDRTLVYKDMSLVYKDMSLVYKDMSIIYYHVILSLLSPSIRIQFTM